MKIISQSLKVCFTLLFALVIFPGCESTDSGSTHTSTTVYYGVGFYDPWYHGDYDYDYDVIVTPPDRPGSGARPSHPIARPPEARPRPTPMPSIPSTPRVSPRGGGGRRR